MPLPPLPESWVASSKITGASFLSADPLQEPPTSFAWESFKKPKLGRYQHELNRVRFEEYLGGGIDGIVFRARFGNADSVILKVFHYDRHSGPRYRYWAFKKECENATLIDMISAAIRSSSSQPIYLKSQVANIEDARRNLRAFSDEGRRPEKRFQLEPGHDNDVTTISLEILPQNKCFGWTKVKGDTVRQALQSLNFTSRSRQYCSPARFNKSSYFAITYAYIPPDEFDLSVAQTQLDFYYLTGFSLAGWKPDNWVGSGMLVDMSDLSSPFQSDWDRFCRPTDAEKFFEDHWEWLEAERAIANGTFEEWRQKKKESLRAEGEDASEEEQNN